MGLVDCPERGPHDMRVGNAFNMSKLGGSDAKSNSSACQSLSLRESGLLSYLDILRGLLVSSDDVNQVLLRENCEHVLGPLSPGSRYKLLKRLVEGWCHDIWGG
jgi:hypothetical protein